MIHTLSTSHPSARPTLGSWAIAMPQAMCLSIRMAMSMRMLSRVPVRRDQTGSRRE